MTIFLDADDKHWILASSRAELIEVLLARMNVDDDADFLRLVAACLNCEEEAVMWVEKAQ